MNRPLTLPPSGWHRQAQLADGSIEWIDAQQRNPYHTLMLEGNRYSKHCHRWNTGGHAHELTFSCYHNRLFLSKERTCTFLVDAIAASRKKHDFDLWAYVFMPDHVHVVICPRQPEYSISAILRSIKQPVSRRAIDYLRRKNPDGLKFLATGEDDEPYRFWQKGGGYDRNITALETLVQSIRYIHNNPVRKGLVETADQWCYSSAADWLNTGHGPISIDVDSFPRA
ncbi:MAG: transposase [Sedimentisphaerales bacterium]|nr:transposase [Sedimentisphaerales bacterium]